MNLTDMSFTIFMSEYLIEDTSGTVPSYCHCIIAQKWIVFS